MGTSGRYSERLPTGVVTFLLTDVEGSSQRWERDQAGMLTAMALHDEIVHRAVAAAGGARPVEQGEGDSVVASFWQASDALACAVELQRAAHAADWPSGCELRIRAAVLTGEAQVGEGGRYAGPAIVRCARLRDLASGGQTLVSRSSFELAADHLPPLAVLRPLGAHRLRGLERPEDVFELVHPELPDDHPPLRSSADPNRTLPVWLTSFVGRDEELATVRSLLAEHRLVTLAGAGGCGKTRLAAESLRQPPGAGDVEVWWVELAPVRDTAFVVAALAVALGVREAIGQDLLDTVTQALAAGRLFVVLDNCEHVVDEVARVCEALLRYCPGVSILATSREPLGVPGEVVRRVPSLPVPDVGPPLDGTAADGAVRLFVERARAAQPHFALDPETWPAVQVICERLDGLPLAIELAAARAGLLSPREIAQGLEESFALVAGGSRTALPRQQTLQRSIEWSYQLLDERERAVLLRASVFAGGFELAAAQAVCADDPVDGGHVLEVLGRLVDKSLVVVDSTRPNARFRLLETIRRYAIDRLAGTEDGSRSRDRHLEHYLALAERAAAELEGTDQLVWLDQLDHEHDNLRAAADWAAARGDVERELRLAVGMWLFWTYRGHLQEARSRLEQALAGDGGPPSLRCGALLALADTMLLGGDFAGLRGPAEEALALAGRTSDRRLAGQILVDLAWSDLMTGDAGARTAFESAIAATRDAADEVWLAYALSGLGYVEVLAGHTIAATEILHEALALARRAGNRKAVAMAAGNLGQLMIETGDFADAEATLVEGRSAAMELGDPLFLTMNLTWLGRLRAQTGDLDRAQALANEALAVGRAANNPFATTLARALSSVVHTASDDPDAGFAAIDEAVAFARLMGLTDLLGLLLTFRADAAYTAGDLQGAGACWSEVAQLGRAGDNPWRLGVACNGLAILALDQGEPVEAERLAHEALASLHDAHYRPAIVDVLETLASVWIQLGAPERAARLVGAAEAERARMTYLRPRPAEDRLAPLLDTVHADFDEHRLAGSAMSLTEAVRYATRGRGRRERPAAGWASLTRSELAVAELVAEGLTNPQIGERLFVSRRTVQAHVSRIFTKLGVSTRAELAAEFTRRSA